MRMLSCCWLSINNYLTLLSFSLSLLPALCYTTHRFIIRTLDQPRQKDPSIRSSMPTVQKCRLPRNPCTLQRRFSPEISFLESSVSPWRERPGSRGNTPVKLKSWWIYVCGLWSNRSVWGAREGGGDRAPHPTLLLLLAKLYNLLVSRLIPH